jgi:hypothetical protein
VSPRNLKTEKALARVGQQFHGIIKVFFGTYNAEFLFMIIPT